MVFFWDFPVSFLDFSVFFWILLFIFFYFLGVSQWFFWISRWNVWISQWNFITLHRLMHYPIIASLRWTHSLSACRREVVHCCTIFLWDLDWKYSALWEPSIWRCRLFLALQRAGMTDLDQMFCMWYFLCIWRAASKKFVNFFTLTPSKRLFVSKWVLHQKCCMYSIYGKPLQIIFSFFVR